ncbi:endopeptidase La [Acetobacteroides hydrogenigenes]|uniref:Lon protease n=1 Tax=Acetobacteroides hydrogenigenes TaxID=979970 RepID=A0A4V2RQX2_9BACT|nr:endopeptidase La [Acetobacteroides hydrogenigenes]TCN73131.1 ATP-dependent Lon protease [Acetobacteroides hydrogenigenes]
MSNKSDISLQNILITSATEDNNEFIPFIANDSEMQIDSSEIPNPLPILALRNAVLFPGVVIPISVGREKSLKLVREQYSKDKIIGAISQIDSKIEEPNQEDLYKIGTIGQILKILEMPDGSTTVILQGIKRFELNQIVETEPYFKGQITELEDVAPSSPHHDYDAIVSSVKDLALKIIKLSPNIPNEASFAIRNIDNPSFLVNFICSNSDITNDEKQKLLDIASLKERALTLLQYLTKEMKLIELKNDIQAKVKFDLDQQQREYYLHQQMKTIQDELGGSPNEQEIEELRKAAQEKKWSKDTQAHFEKEVSKIERMNPAVAEYSIQLNYLQLLLELPWNEYSKDNFDLKRAKRILDEDHFGLDQVKERILEHLAVLKLKGDLKSPIICLYGPPGVGKTSLGKSVAKALGREYGRISLGGLHDEAEIRGHRKTYIGAMPGRIIQTIKKSKYANPVIILDEIDKIGKDFHGDPASALLEVLDPEQNSTFHDNYLELDFDLSKVLFITTANNISTIAPALRDRMEMIEVSGYLAEEKYEIAKQHLIPRQLEGHGVDKSQVKFPKKVLELIIDEYTRESGVRTLDKTIAKVVRNIAKHIAFEEEYNPTLTTEEIRKILGVPRFVKDIYQGNEFAGVVTGLAWTEVGGEILFIETSLSPGKGSLTLTGNLGDVMKESAVIAMEYIKSHSEELNINPEIFDKWNVHIHVPEGAIPKDGPSAGITMTVALTSAFTQQKVRKSLAMTGEITLRGKVIAVGGIKEKILAAKRAGITDIMLSEENRKDIEEIKDEYIKGLKFHFVQTIDDALEFALLNEKVKKPKKLI